MAKIDEPSLVEILQAFREKLLQSVHVGLPGYIVSFDHATRRAVVQLGVKAPKSVDPTDGYESIPPLDDVPIARPRGGGFALSLPMSEGDAVHVVFSEADPSGFRRSGKEEPPDHWRRFGMYACAFPCDWLDESQGPAGEAGKAILEGPGARLVVDGTTVHVGDDVGSDFIALSTKVDAAVNTLLGYINALVLPVAGASAGPLAVPLVAPPPTAATKAKAI